MCDSQPDSHCLLINTFWNLVRHLYRFIYTGNVEVASDNAQDLLRAADQYLLEGLKRLCEYSIAQVCINFLAVEACLNVIYTDLALSSNIMCFRCMKLSKGLSYLFISIFQLILLLLRFWLVRTNFFQIFSETQNLTLETVMNVFDLAEAYHALSLRDTCVLFILKHHEQMCGMTGYWFLWIPIFRTYFSVNLYSYLLDTF